MPFKTFQQRLQTAFDAVADPKDWRAPIDTTLELSELDAVGGFYFIKQAVEHFTGTTPTLCFGIGNVRVQAIGYRNGPAGP